MGQEPVPAGNSPTGTNLQLSPAAPAPPTQSVPPPAEQAAPTQQDKTQPDNTQPDDASPQGPGSSSRQEVQKDEAGMFVMRKQVNEVALHATVMDDQNRIITRLDKSAFTVFEDGHLEAITSFRREDVPVSLGILIDNSGSMREKRAKVDAAALNLVRSSNPEDEVLVVNFNEEGILDQDFTADIVKLKEALERHESRGSTALYDAVDGAAAHLKGSSTHEKRVIFVVTDGEDNASRESLEKVLQSLQQEGGPVVYAIGLLGDQKQERARQDLQLLAQRTGGIAFFPKSIDEVDQISKTVARDIRNQYSIGYKPTKPRSAGGYRLIRVEARAPGYRKLSVRTRRGYDARQDPNLAPGSHSGQ